MTLKGIASFPIRLSPELTLRHLMLLCIRDCLLRKEVIRIRDCLLRKEVIQPLVPQRLPCYDFIPVTNHTLDASVPCRFGQQLRVQSAPMM